MKPTDMHFEMTGPRPAVYDALEGERWWPGLGPRYKWRWPQYTSERRFAIEGVVIHATAGGSSEGAAGVILEKHPKASFHWLIPDEDEPFHGNTIWACVAESRAAWHVRNGCSHVQVNGGRSHSNHWSLGIEIVNRQVRSDGFSMWQVAAAASIVRYCRAKYSGFKWVTSHAALDPDRRDDPGALFPWERFREICNVGGVS